MINRLVILQKKKYVVVIFGMIAITNISSYDEDEDIKQHFRKKAWDSLSDEERSTVLDKWEEAKIRTGSYWLTNEEAIMVVFTTTEDRSIGPIIVYIDPATNYIFEVLSEYK